MYLINSFIVRLIMLDNFKIEKIIISLQKMVIRRNPDATPNGAVTPHNYV